MKTQCFYVVILLVLPMLAAAHDAAWTPVPNVNDPVIQSYGETAVTDYNKSSGATLRFNIVISACSLGVYLGTTNFRLTLTAKDGGATNTYEAFVQNTSGKLSLLSFTHITA